MKDQCDEEDDACDGVNESEDGIVVENLADFGILHPGFRIFG